MELKPISAASIPNALTRAKHYRLLNEPWQAESICRDILNIDPGHQIALRYLILAITDQFGGQKGASRYAEAKKRCTELQSDYEKKYYRGIIEERLGKITLLRNTPRVKYIAYEHYHRAMDLFEEAQQLSPEGNQDAVLRWNACVRRIEQYKLVRSPDDDHHTRQLLDV